MAIEVIFQPLGRRVKVSPGVAIMEAARSAGLNLTALCGGNGSCGKCLVILPADSKVSDIEPAESDMIDADLLSRGYRLACRVKIYEALSVTIPSESLSTRHRIQVEGIDLDIKTDPPVQGYRVELSAATTHDLRADWERLSDDFIDRKHLPPLIPELAAVQQLPFVLRKNRWQAKIGIRGDRVVAVDAPGASFLGLAIDLGTTKIAAHLVDMETGRTLAMTGVMNPQISFGEDVISRISHVMSNEAGADDLQSSVIQAINRLAGDLCRQAADAIGQDSCHTGQIVETVIAGNTAMHHLLLKLPVRQLGLAPYIAAVTGPMDVRADEIGIDIAKGAYVHFYPNIAGFVGGDHVAMLMAVNLAGKNGVRVAMDIGTNTEVTLSANGRMICCSTASGPAFEGAHIRDGMRAAPGAIERVWITSREIRYQTIDHEKPIGICGSGVLEALAQLRQAGMIDIDGGLLSGPPMIRKGEKGLEVLVSTAGQSGNGRDIVITRKDISEIQMAKGAIRTGLDFLLKETGYKTSDIDEFIVAGAFGTYLQVRDAIQIGMFPELPIERFRQVGNAAGAGAKIALLSKAKRKEAVCLSKNLTYCELTNVSGFQDMFMASLDLSRW